MSFSEIGSPFEADPALNMRLGLVIFRGLFQPKLPCDSKYNAMEMHIFSSSYLIFLAGSAWLIFPPLEEKIWTWVDLISSVLNFQPVYLWRSDVQRITSYKIYPTELQRKKYKNVLAKGEHYIPICLKHGGGENSFYKCFKLSHKDMRPI